MSGAGRDGESRTEAPDGPGPIRRGGARDGGGLNARTVRRSLVGAALGGALFGAVSVYRSWVAEGPLLDYLGPVSILVVIGATVGGLAGPLVGRAIARSGRERRGEDGEGAEPTGPRQPLWATLVVGLVIGYGIGASWERPLAGVGFGLLLAFVSHRIFR